MNTTNCRLSTATEEQHVRLRPFTRRDLRRYLKWINDPYIIRHWADPFGQTMEGLESWWAGYVEDDSERWFTILVDRRPIGVLTLSGASRSTAQVGAFIGERGMIGKGYGTEALCMLIERARSELGSRHFWLEVSDTNMRAIRSFSKVGFTETDQARTYTADSGREYTFVKMVLDAEDAEGESS